MRKVSVYVDSMSTCLDSLSTVRYCGTQRGGDAPLGTRFDSWTASRKVSRFEKQLAICCLQSYHHLDQHIDMGFDYALQETTFIEQVVEDESQMEAIPPSCSTVMNWHLHLDAHNVFYPKGWQLEKNLDSIVS